MKGPFSITSRLAGLFVLSAGILFIIILEFSYQTLAYNLAREDNESLDDKVDMIRLLLANPPKDPSILARIVQRSPAQIETANFYVRVFSPKEKGMLETPGMSPLLPSSVFPFPGIKQRHPPKIEWRDPHGILFILTSLDVKSKPSNKILTVQFAMERSDDEIILRQYHFRLLLLYLAALVCFSFIGITIAKRGLKPLAKIALAMQSVDATKLHQKIGFSNQPKELRGLAAAFDGMLIRLEKSFLQLSQFSADLAHELRTPFHNLLVQTEVLLSQERSTEEYRQTLESNMEEYKHLAKLVDNLLFLSRAENVEVPIAPVKIDVHNLLDSIIEFYDAVATENGVRVDCQGNAILYADPVLFRRVISNLLSNALNYTPRNGSVVFTICEKEDGFVEIIVADTGCGIASEHLPRVFERFYRVDASRSEPSRGIGLGLAIVKSIMQLHGGTISIESNLQQGTKVYLGFPPRGRKITKM